MCGSTPKFSNSIKISSRSASPESRPIISRATGQRWGNPLYRWDVLAARGFAWWIDRIRRATGLYDIVRLDHFRGFEAYWAIPAKEETAVNGEWVKAPGLELFRALEAALGAAAARG